MQEVAKRTLPRGKVDVLLQLALFAACYGGYQAVRGQVDGAEQDAFWNATQLISLEQGLHIFVEPGIQAWSVGTSKLIDVANWMYLNSHYVVTVSALVYIYLKKHQYFATVRNAFLVAMILALVGYALVPTAPPRMMPEWGFHDTIAQATGIRAEDSAAGGMVNFYAAVPSMHVCFALLIGGWMGYLTAHRLGKALWMLYPLLVMWVVIATGNHYLADVVLGAATALVAVIVARTALRSFSLHVGK